MGCQGEGRGLEGAEGLGAVTLEDAMAQAIDAALASARAVVTADANMNEPDIGDLRDKLGALDKLLADVAGQATVPACLACGLTLGHAPGCPRAALADA